MAHRSLLTYVQLLARPLVSLLAQIACALQAVKRDYVQPVNYAEESMIPESSAEAPDEQRSSAAPPDILWETRAASPAPAASPVPAAAPAALPPAPHLQPQAAYPGPPGAPPLQVCNFPLDFILPPDILWGNVCACCCTCGFATSVTGPATGSLPWPASRSAPAGVLLPADY